MKNTSALKLSWNEVRSLISDELLSILNKEIVCNAKADDFRFWSVEFCDYKMPISEIGIICKAINATDETTEEAMPWEEDMVGYVRDFGLAVSSMLLSKKIGYKWEDFLATDDCLWLIGCEKI